MEYAIKILRNKKMALLEKFEELNEDFYKDRFGTEQIKMTQTRIDNEIHELNQALGYLELKQK